VSRSDEQRVQDILDAADQVVDIAQVGRDAWDKDRLRQLATGRRRTLRIPAEPSRRPL